MRRAVKFLLPAAVAALALAPVQARAEGYISPWVATNAGTGFNNDNLGSSFSNGRVGIGTQVGAMGKGIFGAELDLGWSPSFFGTTNDFGNKLCPLLSTNPFQLENSQFIKYAAD